MTRTRSRARTVAAVVFIVGAWLACGPLTAQRDDQLRTPFPGLDASTEIDEDGGSDAFAPPDIPMEGGGGSDAFMPADIAMEGGGSDAAFVPDAGLPFDAFPDAPRPPDAAVIFDAAPDAPPDARSFDAAAPFDSNTRFDAPTGGGGSSLRMEDISFYDCRCAGSHAPTGGWPIFGAILFVIVRRRSGSSSAR